MEDRHRIVFGEKSRRAGFTWAEAFWSTSRRLMFPFDHLFSSADEDSGVEFLEYCRDFAEAFNRFLGEPYIDFSEWTKTTALFPNGSRILVLSSNPKNFRGKQGDVSMDEAAWHERFAEAFKAAQPCLMWVPDARLHVFSSHSGESHPFYLMCDQIRAGKKGPDWSLHTVTIEDAVRDGLALKVPGPHQRWLSLPGGRQKCDRAFIKGLRDQAATQEDFDQEFMCRPGKTSTLVKAHEYDAVALWEVPQSLDPRTPRNDLFVGIDCGRVKDLTVVWVLERGHDPSPSTPDHLRDVFRTVAVRAFANTSFPEQERQILSMLGARIGDIAGVWIDQGSVGRGLADTLAEELGDIVRPVGIGNKQKAEIGEVVRQFVQQQRVSLPKNDPQARASILAFRRKFTEAGTVIYDGHTDFDHCDYFIALGLGLLAAGDSLGFTTSLLNPRPAEHRIQPEQVNDLAEAEVAAPAQP